MIRLTTALHAAQAPNELDAGGGVCVCVGADQSALLLHTPRLSGTLSNSTKAAQKI